MKSSKWLHTSVFAAVGVMSIGGCQIGFGDGGNHGCGTNCADLGVPFRWQDNTWFCAPSSILMWRLYDGLMEVPQSEIATAIGCTIGQGTQKEKIDDGVRIFTNTGANAVLDFGPNQGVLSELQGIYFTAEINSMGDAEPFIGFVEGGIHAVIIYGGSWTEVGPYLRWDTTRFHDPIDRAQPDKNCRSLDG